MYDISYVVQEESVVFPAITSGAYTRIMKVPTYKLIRQDTLTKTKKSKSSKKLDTEGNEQQPTAPSTTDSPATEAKAL